VLNEEANSSIDRFAQNMLAFPLSYDVANTNLLEGDSRKVKENLLNWRGISTKVWYMIKIYYGGAARRRTEGSDQ
jgi:hypothetical protein